MDDSSLYGLLKPKCALDVFYTTYALVDNDKLITYA